MKSSQENRTSNNLAPIQSKDKKQALQPSNQINFSASYKVPALDGKFLQAIPIKLCIKFRPPTIAVVYKLDPMSGNRTMPAKSSKRYDKKYIHEIYVEKMTPRTDLMQLCDKLCDKEAYYLNPAIISKTQVSFYIIVTLLIGVRIIAQTSWERVWQT